jgi:dienelactone hydrolase
MQIERGNHKVNIVRDYRLRDNTRGKEIPLRLFVPADSGSYPLVLFSHGAGSSKEGYSRLMRFWASHGFGCVLPDHDDSISRRRREGRDSSLSEILEELSTDYAGWENRAQDLAFIIDSIGELNALPECGGHIDGSRVIAGGHSYGAFTAQMLGGVTIRIPGGKENFRHKSVRAILLLSPQGRNKSGLGFSDGAWDQLDLPLLAITGSADKGLEGQEPHWRSEPFQLSPPGGKVLLFIDGADHLSMTGSGIQRWMGEERDHIGADLRKWLTAGDRDRDAQEQIFNCVKAVTLSFLHDYLFPRNSEELPRTAVSLPPRAQLSFR